MLVLIGRNLGFIWAPDTSAVTIGSFAITAALFTLSFKMWLGRSQVVSVQSSSFTLVSIMRLRYVK